MNATLLRLIFGRLHAPEGEGAPGGAAPAGATGSASAGTMPPAEGTPAPGGGSPGPAGVPPAPAPKDTRTASERAYARAQERKKNSTAAGGTPAGHAQSSATAVPGQAPGGEPAPGAGTPAPPGAEAGQPKGEAADGGATPPGSTVEIPPDWPTEDREKMAKLPAEGQSLVLDMHKRMHAGFTHVMTQLAEEKSRRQDLHALDEQFQRGDAKGVIAELAKRAGLEVYFERPLAEGEIPEDVKSDPVKYGQWIADEAAKKAEARVRQEHEARDVEANKRRAADDLGRELKEATAAHADFAAQRPAVLQQLARAPGLSVEDAYRLVTYAGLAKRAGAADKAEQELAAAKAELEKQRKAATQPPAAATGPATPKPDTQHLSPGERAYKRASARRAARGNTQVRA